MHVRGCKPVKLDDERIWERGSKAYIGVFEPPVRIDRIRSSATATYVYTTTSCDSRRFSSSGNTETSCSFVSCSGRLRHKQPRALKTQGTPDSGTCRGTGLHRPAAPGGRRRPRRPGGRQKCYRRTIARYSRSGSSPSRLAACATGSQLHAVQHTSSEKDVSSTSRCASRQPRRGTLPRPCSSTRPRPHAPLTPPQADARSIRARLQSLRARCQHQRPRAPWTTSAAGCRGVATTETCSSARTYSRGVSSNASTSRVRSARFGTTTPATSPLIVTGVSKISR